VQVIDALHQLYSAGKPCNDINVLLDILEPDESARGGRSAPARPATGTGWKLFGR
jgi:hypothetical protein